MYYQNVMAVPNDVKGITATRNWILKNCQDVYIVMMNDDLFAQGYFEVEEQAHRVRKLYEKEWHDVFHRLFEVTEDVGFKIWGVTRSFKFEYSQPFNPFSFRGEVTGSCMGIVNDGEYLFDEEFVTKEDYELCLRHIFAEGGIVQARHVFVADDRDMKAKGGCAGYRTKEVEKLMIKKLRNKYPGFVNAKWTKREYVTYLNV